MARLLIDARDEGETQVFSLRGSLTDGARAALERATSNARHKVALDWDQVILASSDGLRDWIAFFGVFAKGHLVEFRKLRASLVTSFNLIPLCFQGARVSSLYGNFCCSECRKEHEVLLSVGSDVSHDGTLLRNVACIHCGADATLNVPEEDFFQIVALTGG